MSDLLALFQRRADIIQSVVDDPKAKPEIVEATDNARSTVDRGIRELSKNGLVRAEKSRYEATSAAACILECYEAFQRKAELYYEVREAISGLPPCERIPPAYLRDAKITMADRENPGKVLIETSKNLDEADALYGVYPSFLAYYAEYIHSAIVDNGLEMKVVCSPGVVDGLAAEDVALQDVLDTGNCTIYLHENLPSYGIAYSTGTPNAREGTRAGLLIYSRHGNPHSGIRNDTDEAVQWAKNQYESYVQDATQVFP